MNEDEQLVTRSLKILSDGAPTFVGLLSSGRPTEYSARSDSGDQSHGRQGRSWLASTLAAAAVVAAIAGVSWAAREHGSSPSSESRQPTATTSTTTSHPDATRDEVRAMAAKIENQFNRDPGFASTSLDFASSTVAVYWKGSPPAELSALASAQGAVAVEIHPATYSADDVRTAGHQLIEAYRNSATPVFSVAPLPDYSGAIAYVDASDPTTLVRLGTDFGQLTGVSFTARRGEPIVQQ